MSGCWNGPASNFLFQKRHARLSKVGHRETFQFVVFHAFWEESPWFLLERRREPASIRCKHNLNHKVAGRLCFLMPRDHRAVTPLAMSHIRSRSVQTTLRSPPLPYHLFIMAFPPDPTAEGQTTAEASAADADTGEPAQKRARPNANTPSGGDAAASTNNDQAEGIGTADKTRLYSCGKCSKSYARLDHLSRHVRMHTQEKPYQCQGENASPILPACAPDLFRRHDGIYPIEACLQHQHAERTDPSRSTVCTKAFARADLLKRHSLGHNKDDQQSKPSIVQHSRVSQACEACAGLHLKCEEEKPCKRCSKKGIKCNYTSNYLPNDIQQSPPRHSPSQEQHSQQVHHRYPQQQQQQQPQQQQYSEHVHP